MWNQCLWEKALILLFCLARTILFLTKPHEMPDAGCKVTSNLTRFLIEEYLPQSGNQHQASKGAGFPETLRPIPYSLVFIRNADYQFIRGKNPFMQGKRKQT